MSSDRHLICVTVSGSIQIHSIRLPMAADALPAISARDSCVLIAVASVWAATAYVAVKVKL